jgi:hypothetical protein
VPRRNDGRGVKLWPPFFEGTGHRSVPPIPPHVRPSLTYVGDSLHRFAAQHERTEEGSSSRSPVYSLLFCERGSFSLRCFWR